MSQNLTIVVTGSNRGIGQGIIQLLAKTKHQHPLIIYATSRSGAYLDIQPLHSNEVRYSKLDVGDKTSIVSFLENTISKDAPINVLINNAGINNNNRETPDLACQVIDVNYRGTRDMCRMFLEDGKMSRNQGARIVNVSSAACQLSNYDPPIQDPFRAVETISDVDSLAEKYESAVHQGQDAQQKQGWGSGSRSYQVSKALVNALTVVLAQDNTNVMVNCCCPGWVNTDMGHQVGKPPKTLEEGARIPVRLAIGALGPEGDKDGGLGKETEFVSGMYFKNDSVSDRGWGKTWGW